MSGIISGFFPWATFLLLTLTAAAVGVMADDADSPSLKAVARANTEFTSSLYDVLTKAVDGNLICSPFSLSAVMAMVKAGAGGETSSAIQKAMKYPPSDDTLFKGYKALLSTLKSDGGNFTLETVNRVYSKPGFDLKPDFTKTLTTYFGSPVEQLDFTQSDKAADTINSFVKDKTRGKITDLISAGDLDAMTRLVLVNAIYFKGLWKNQFDPLMTKEKDFHLNKKDTVKVPMMKLEADFPYGEIEELDAKVVALPYKGEKLAMIIILPNEVEGLKGLEEKLKTYPLGSIPTKLRERKINLSLPKFTLESTIDLKGPLTQLGAGAIFDQSKADFSGMPVDPKEQLFVSKAVQKAFIEVNEEGSEAAAATGLVAVAFSLPMITDLVVDHPFIAYISMSLPSSSSTPSSSPKTTNYRKKSSNPSSSSSTQLFVAKVVRPEYSGK